MGLLARIAEALPRRDEPAGENRFSVDTWLSDYLVPSQMGGFVFGGNSYSYGGINTTLGTLRAQEIERSLPGYSMALRSCPPAFAAQMVRALVLSQARFTFRNRPSSGSKTPRRTFGTNDLSLLERPWPNGTTGELISRMEWHGGIAGNAYVTNRTRGRLRMLRPDWTAIVYGSETDPDNPALALDSELLGYVYQNGGIGNYDSTPQFLLPDEVAHWSPIPDPLHAGIGMSYLTPAVREIQSDALMTEHKIRFFQNSATPNMVVKGLQAASPAEFNALVDMLEDAHAGVRNAYKTLYLTQGADATVVGADLRQIDFKEVQANGETRLTMLSRVPAAILGTAAGLEGSSLNAGNFTASRRAWADTWIYPTLQDLCHAVAPLVSVPGDAELWFDTADMPILREDAKDAAEIASIEASAITGLAKDGFTRDSAKAAIIARDMSLLVPDPNWVSVQLQQSNGSQSQQQQGQPMPNGKANQ